jgi:hypothetical protein
MPVIVLLVVINGFMDSRAETAQPPTYPSLWECFDPDFQKAVLLALQKEFRGQYRDAVGTKKAALVVVDITDLQDPKVASLNPDVIFDAENGYKYIIVALVEHPLGDEGLARLAAVVDQVMDGIHAKSK